MYDLRDKLTINLANAVVLKDQTTYKYKDEKTGKFHVIKIIENFDIGENGFERFLWPEFKKMINLSAEPEIATALFVAKAKLQDLEYDCYVMEYVEGITLKEYLTQNYITVEAKKQIIRELASALEKAHSYEIFHGDLHDENIIIDKFGNVKIIDFLWYDFSPSTKRQTRDMESFHKLVEAIQKRSSEYDNRFLQLYFAICNKAKIFKGLKKQLEQLDTVSFEYGLLSDNAVSVLSMLLENMPTNFLLDQSLIQLNCRIPDKYSYPDVTGNFIDKRLLSIESRLKQLSQKNLKELKSAGFISEIRINVKNKGNDNIGPYVFDYQIDLGYKAVQLKKIDLDISILPKFSSLNFTKCIFEFE